MTKLYAGQIAEITEAAAVLRSVPIHHWPIMRKAQRDLCPLCNGVLGLYVSDDHVVPRAYGGGRQGNLVLAHIRCNNARHHQWPTGCQVIMLAAVNLALAKAQREYLAQERNARLYRKRRSSGHVKRRNAVAISANAAIRTMAL